jgi:ketosteroid isomerase-like protein
MTTTSSTTETADRLAIIELIGRLVQVLDARDWDALGELFTDSVYSDRTSLLGGDPVTVSRNDFVAGWKQTLQNFDAVHHMITCHVITLDGDRATCTANMMGTHIYTNHSGGPVWTVGGRHDYRLERAADGWQIAGLTFTIQWASGNMNIVNLAVAGQR